jgi:hypothetical protein
MAAERERDEREEMRRTWRSVNKVKAVKREGPKLTEQRCRN